MIPEQFSKSTTAFKAINLACGDKLCRENGWLNADHCPSAKDVVKINLLKPLPYSDNTFDVVYHSQFIEHLPAKIGLKFICECHRVLKPKGILRVVTPDLQNQAEEYLLNLQAALNSPNDEDARLRYDWIRLEMLDQLNRHTSGGDMVKLLEKSGEDLSDYLWQRLGRSGKNLIPPEPKKDIKPSLKEGLRRLKQAVTNGLDRLTPESLRVGRFRLSGEAHLCMYDGYLLTNLLAKAGFCEIAKLSAKESKIPNWNLTLLDCDSQGYPDSGNSLFMEGTKSNQTNG